MPLQSSQPILQTVPLLKQKTGIIKSKVPPPVPPRGSPRVDRRTSASSHASPRATPSSGRHEMNYLNDKYFDTIQPNANNLCRLSPQHLYTKDDRPVSPPRTPIFRNRSPTCVRDWLEVNDFAASDYDESVLQFKITEPTKCVTIKPRKPLPIRTAHLQRQSSFRAFSYSSDSSVRCKVEKYAEHNDIVATQNIVSSSHDDTAGISVNIVSERIRSYDCNQNDINDNNNNINNNNNTIDTIPHPETIDIQTTIEKGSLFKLRKAFENSSSYILNDQPVPVIRRVTAEPMAEPMIKPMAKPRLKKYKKSTALHMPQVTFSENSDDILKTLKRKNAPPNGANTDENDNIEKIEILKNHSNIISVENANYLDTFSLDGEFV